MTEPDQGLKALIDMAKDFCDKNGGMNLRGLLEKSFRTNQLITLSNHLAAVKAAVDRVVTVDQLKAISLALSKITGRNGADEAALDCLASEVRSIRARANGGE